MAALRIEPTEDTPQVILNRETEQFEISGKSLPEDVIEFYHPVLDWMLVYKKEPLNKTIFNFKLVYFNTASSKLILNLLMILEEIQMNGHEVLIRWFSPVTDEDIKEAGEEYGDMMKLKFEHISYDE
ncbi:MAG: DUF1987 domain-containing protein [Bacteroidales bacterium]